MKRSENMSERKYGPKDIASILRVCNSAAFSCAGCKLNEDKCCDSVNIELQAADAIEELLAQVRWVPVGERLPDLDDGAVLLDGELVAVKVLVAIEGAKRSTELYFDGEEFFDYTGDEIIPYRVTHWRPMPEVPGEEG
jgi:hypothetical protein